MNNDPSYWEALLANEGMAEISLFDNTGRQHSITFVSTSIVLTGGDEELERKNIWAENVNIERYGEQTPAHDVDTAAYWRELSNAVADLPPGWPKAECDLLSLYADCGFFERAYKELGLPRNFAYAAKRRFESWLLNTIG